MFETAEEAVAREIKEETGLSVAQPRYCFTIPNVYTYSGFDVHTLDMFFEVKADQTEILTPADDVARLFWLSKEEIDLEKIGLLSIREGVRRRLQSPSGQK